MKIEAPEDGVQLRREAVETIIQQVDASPETARVVNGLAMTSMPGDEARMLMIPVQNGMAQSQHIVCAKEVRCRLAPSS